MKQLDGLFKKSKLHELTEKIACQTVTFDSKQMPDLDGKEIGDSVLLLLEAEVVGLLKEDGKTVYTLEVQKGDVGQEKKEPKKVEDIFNSDKKSDSDDFSEDILRPKALQSKAHRFNQQITE